MNTEQRGATLRSRIEELRLWLIVNGMLDACFFFSLVASDKPMTLVGLMLLLHLLVALPVFYGFHKVALAEARLDDANLSYDGTRNYATDEPCEGRLGRRGTGTAFVCYFGYFGLHAHRLALVYTTCALSTYKMHLDAVSYLELIGAFCLLVAALAFVEIARRSRMENSVDI